MNKNAFLIIALLASAGLLRFTSAEASQLGPYVGGFYGQGEKSISRAPFSVDAQQVETEIFNFQRTSVDERFDNKDSVFGGVLGVRIHAYFAIEGAFLDLGSVEYRAVSQGVADGEATTVQTRLESKSTGIGLYGLVLWPINYRWEVYGRLGAQFTSSRLDLRANSPEGSVLGRLSESSGDVVAGAGIVMSIAEIYGVRLEYQRVLDAGHRSTGEADTDIASLGVIVAF